MMVQPLPRMGNGDGWGLVQPGRCGLLASEPADEDVCHSAFEIISKYKSEK